MTKKEHDHDNNIFITEKSGMSFAILIALVPAIWFIVTIAGDTSANAGRLTANEARHDQLRLAYIQHSRIMDDNVANMRSDIGEIKGMLKAMLSDYNNKNTKNK